MNREAWQRLAEVPHRAYFTGGVCAVLLLTLWWMLALPLAGLTAVPSPLVHGLIMPLGVFPPFMLGFVFTAGPRWLGAEAPQGHLPLAIGQFLGLLLCLAGFAAGGFWAVPGLLLLLTVWWRATWLWHCCIDAAPQADRRHPYCILVAMMVGNVALLMTMAWVLSGDGAVWRVARDLILWGWILPIFLTVAHRMIPFFTQAVIPQRAIWRPIGVLYGCLAGCAALVVADIAALPQLGLLASIAMAVATGITAVRWAGYRLRGACAGNRLLAMLHLSFAWLPLAFLLLALSHAGVPLGTAAQHAIGMGFCFTLMVGFVTRVTLGHSGNPLVPSNAHWYLYLALHGVALLRVLAAALSLSVHALHGVAALWMVVAAAWAWQVLPLYWKPRADGKPG